MKNKWYIFIFMLIATMAMLSVPVIPHHHHANSNICLRHDNPSDDINCTHHGHNSQGENDTCCDENCQARLKYRTPDISSDIQVPQFVCFIALYCGDLINHLLEFREQTLTLPSLYLESLHGTNIVSAFSLRGPPYALMA